MSELDMGWTADFLEGMWAEVCREVDREHAVGEGCMVVENT